MSGVPMVVHVDDPWVARWKRTAATPELGVGRVRRHRDRAPHRGVRGGGGHLTGRRGVVGIVDVDRVALVAGGGPAVEVRDDVPFPGAVTRHLGAARRGEAHRLAGAARRRPVVGARRTMFDDVAHRAGTRRGRCRPADGDGAVGDDGRRQHRCVERAAGRRRLPPTVLGPERERSDGEHAQPGRRQARRRRDGGCVGSWSCARPGCEGVCEGWGRLPRPHPSSRSWTTGWRVVDGDADVLAVVLVGHAIGEADVQARPRAEVAAGTT